MDNIFSNAQLSGQKKNNHVRKGIPSNSGCDVILKTSWKFYFIEKYIYMCYINIREKRKPNGQSRMNKPNTQMKDKQTYSTENYNDDQHEPHHRM